MATSSARVAAPSHRSRVGPWAAAMALSALLVWGFAVRAERYLVAEAGLGYWLGVAGLACMTALLLYTVRKRVGIMHGLGPVRRWLSLHMLLGIVGPVCILFHANFRLGSFNSNVALVCVLLVASSGLVGRLLYPRIHYGMAGRRATLKDIRSAIDARRHELAVALERDAKLAECARELEARALEPGGLPRLVARAVSIGPRFRLFQRRGLALGVSPATLGRFVDAVRRVLALRICERLFALWHAFHLPLCALLFGAAALHVVAVHLY